MRPTKITRRLGAFAVVSLAVAFASLAAGSAVIPEADATDPVVTGTVVVEADTTISTLRSDTALGDEPWLRADLSPGRSALLAFRLPETDAVVTSMTLQVWVRHDAGGFAVASVLGDWDESTTLESAPPLGPVFAAFGPTVEPHWVDVPLPVELATDGVVSVALIGSSDEKSEFASREALRPPVLRYALEPGGPHPSPGVTGSTGATGPEPTGPVVTGPTPSVTPSDVPTTGTPTPSATPSQAPPPTIVAAGDIACAPDSDAFSGTADECRMAETAALVSDLAPTAVLALGDLQYENGTLDAFTRSYDLSWGRFLGITYPVPGNHEYGTPSAAGYFSYFGDRAGDPQRGYYSFDLGAWHIAAVNSNCAAVDGCDPGSPQVSWLRDDLAASDATCTLAFWHHPRFSSGSEHGSNAGMQTLWETFVAAGGDVVLTGHDHNYERFAELDADGDAAPDGARQFVVGTGGKSLRPIGDIHPDSEAHVDTEFGVLELTLGATSYDWRFVAEDGSVLDQGSSTCSA